MTATELQLTRRASLADRIAGGIASLRANPTTREARKPLNAPGSMTETIRVGDRHFGYDRGKLTISHRLAPEVQDNLEQQLRGLSKTRDEQIEAASSNYTQQVATLRADFEAKLTILSATKDDSVKAALETFDTSATQAMLQAAK